MRCPPTDLTPEWHWRRVLVWVPLTLPLPIDGVHWQNQWHPNGGPAYRAVATRPAASTSTMLEVAGTCNYDLFSRVVAELDLEHASFNVYDPDRFTLTAGEWRELEFNHRIPCVRCSFEGVRDELFQFDTGAGQAVVLHAPAVQRLKLLAGRQTSPTSIGGVGGMIDACVGKLGAFQTAGSRASDVTALFVTAKVGAFMDPYTTGTFGAGLLGPARVVFDYSHRCAVILQAPNGRE